MQRYRVRIEQPVHGESFYRDAPDGINNKDQGQARRFRGYHDAVVHLASALHPPNGGLNEPVTITIEPVPQDMDRPWTVEEILAREG
jgi:hypothetical protein